MKGDRSVKSVLKHTYHRVDNKVVNTLTYLGRNDKRQTVKHPIIPVYKNEEYETLLGLARQYDIEQFFQLEEITQKHTMKIGYRVILKSYQAVRDAGMKTVKTVYRASRGRV